MASSHAKRKKRQTEVTKPRQSQFFQILQFQKEHSVVGFSIHTWGKSRCVSGNKIIPLGKQGRDQVPFPHLSSHSVDLEAISKHTQQPERQEHKERGKGSPWHAPWIGKKIKLKTTLKTVSPGTSVRLCRAATAFLYPKARENLTDKVKDENRAWLGIFAVDREAVPTGDRKSFPRRIWTKNLFALCLPPCRVWSQFLS